MDRRSVAHGPFRFCRRRNRALPADRSAAGRRQGGRPGRADRRTAGPPPRAAAGRPAARRGGRTRQAGAARARLSRRAARRRGPARRRGLGNARGRARQSETLRVKARWEVLAEQVQTRRDGLVSQTTWLLNLDEAGPRFAMLLDFFPASVGRRGSVFTPGERFQGELAFYPSRQPLRALLVARAAAEDAANPEWPTPETALADTLTEPLLAEPWTIEIPVLLPTGRIALDDAGHPWWRSADGAEHAAGRRQCRRPVVRHRSEANGRDLVRQPAHDPRRTDLLGADRRPWLRQSTMRWVGPDALDHGIGRRAGRSGMERRAWR